LTDSLGGNRFGAIILTAFTLPLALCYPNPVPSQGGTSEIVAWRRLTCTFLPPNPLGPHFTHHLPQQDIFFAAGEAGIGTTMLYQYMAGNSGMSDRALLVGAATMGLFLGMRAFFLYARPSWMEAQGNAKKVM